MIVRIMPNNIIIISIITTISIIIITRGSNLLAQTRLRRARARGRMPGVPAPGLASTAGWLSAWPAVGQGAPGWNAGAGVEEAVFF